MADKTPAQKMRLAPGMKAALLHVPDGMRDSIGVPDGVEVVGKPADAAFVLEFATSQAEAEKRLTALAPNIGAKTIAWIAYPKGSKAAGHDLNRDTIFTFMRTVGLIANSNISIDDTWSALRFRPLKPGE